MINRLRDKESNNNIREYKYNTSPTIVSDGEVIIVYEDFSTNLTSQDYKWVICSVASFHVTPHHDYFTSYIVGDFGHVKIEN